MSVDLLSFMKIRVFSLSLAATLLAAVGGNGVLAQTAQYDAQLIKLSPEAEEILCERFPLNSRCAGAETTAEMSPATSEAETSTEAPAAEDTSNASAGTIVDVAAANGSFKTLTAAIEAAGLTETLSGEGPFTVFAPTDAAFAALPPGTVENLLKPENKEQLVQLLTYHVVPQSLPASGLQSGEVTTVAGAPLNVSVDAAAQTVKVNEASVTQADVQASNGVIHVVDQVLMPPTP